MEPTRSRSATRSPLRRVPEGSEQSGHFTTVRIAGSLVIGLLLSGCAGGGDVASPQNRVCPPSDCESSATYTGRILLGSADPTRLEIMVCRNVICATVFLTPLASAPSVYSATLLGPLTGQVLLTGPPDLSGNADFRVHITGNAAALMDGDNYTVRVGLPGQEKLFGLSHAVDYEVVRAAASDCDPGCKQATL